MRVEEIRAMAVCMAYNLDSAADKIKTKIRASADGEESKSGEVMRRKGKRKYYQFLRAKSRRNLAFLNLYRIIKI